MQKDKFSSIVVYLYSGISLFVYLKVKGWPITGRIQKEAFSSIVVVANTKGRSEEKKRISKNNSSDNIEHLCFYISEHGWR